MRLGARDGGFLLYAGRRRVRVEHYCQNAGSFSQEICVLAFDDLGVVLYGLCSVYGKYHRDRINPTSIIVEVRND